MRLGIGSQTLGWRRSKAEPVEQVGCLVMNDDHESCRVFGRRRIAPASLSLSLVLCLMRPGARAEYVHRILIEVAES